MKTMVDKRDHDSVESDFRFQVNAGKLYTALMEGVDSDGAVSDVLTEFYQ
jgi:hypothetical protein